eukprot:CAMPEP_0171267184 /NCGR_PEP_ID=MMETSP0790-20130122/59028_1 /TAXON_ID=2925 /ORGANISM="Alexandrium catenella, Strain OF101" /LENGTH=62 /DNA_ID=CAMNT_0011735913 /DNA_START=45 /DNA_END=230 /DNA_ORIENTATION=-
MGHQAWDAQTPRPTLTRLRAHSYKTWCFSISSALAILRDLVLQHLLVINAPPHRGGNPGGGG